MEPNLKLKRLNRWIVVTLILILAVVGGVIFILLRPEPINYPADRYVADNFELYFVPSDQSLARLAETLEGSRIEIVCALRSLNDPKIEDLIESKERQGVKVRLYIDSDYAGNQRLYLPYVRFAPEGYAMMHSNYCVIDDAIVITGSTILNENTLEYNFHDLLILNSTDLAKEYTSDFWIWYNNQTPLFNETLEKQVFRINAGTTAVPYFCPYDACEKVLVDAIDSAQHNISFAVYALTNPAVKDALKRAQEREVYLIGVVEQQGLTPSSIAYDHVPGVRIDQFNRRVHTKLFVIDGNVSITGSLNPSLKGVTVNQENVLVIHNPDIAAVYADYIAYLFEYRKNI